MCGEYARISVDSVKSGRQGMEGVEGEGGLGDDRCGRVVSRARSGVVAEGCRGREGAAVREEGHEREACEEKSEEDCGRQ